MMIKNIFSQFYLSIINVFYLIQIQIFMKMHIFDVSRTVLPSARQGLHNPSTHTYSANLPTNLAECVRAIQKCHHFHKSSKYFSDPLPHQTFKAKLAMKISIFFY